MVLAKKKKKTDTLEKIFKKSLKKRVGPSTLRANPR